MKKGFFCGFSLSQRLVYVHVIPLTWSFRDQSCEWAHTLWPKYLFFLRLKLSLCDSGWLFVLAVVMHNKLRPNTQVDLSLVSLFLSSPVSHRKELWSRGQELLAVKLALEEWWHLLEGAEQPFCICTDHKNLTYLRTAKKLNARQARWSLFFTRFNVSISYCPGSLNVKPDTLSSQFTSDTKPLEVPTILPASCKIGNITWEVEEAIRQALEANPTQLQARWTSVTSQQPSVTNF